MSFHKCKDLTTGSHHALREDKRWTPGRAKTSKLPPKKGWKWSRGAVGGKQCLHMSKKCWPLKVEGKVKIDFDFLALQAKPHKLFLKKKAS